MQSPVSKEDALQGRSERIAVPEKHFVLGTPLEEQFTGLSRALLGMGCFWGAERKYWEQPGVYSTAVGFSAGHTPNPTYREVCSGQTGHSEVVRVIFDATQTTYESILKTFWESHNPTEGMQQGNDVGTQYRSGIYFYDDDQARVAKSSLMEYQRQLSDAGFGPITTEIVAASEFYFAEEYHQQYLAKNPDGYCGLGGTGVTCPTASI